LLIAVLLAIRFVFDSQAEWRSLRIAAPLFALVIFGIVQFLPFRSASPFQTPTLSLDPQATKEATVKLLALTIYFIAALYTLRRSGRRKTLLVVLTIFGFAVSLFAIIQRLTSNNKLYWVRPVSPYIAFYGPYGNYNHFAGMVELILPLPLAYLLLAKINFEQRLLWLFSVVLMAVAVIFSISRGGMLALGVEVLALMLIAAALRNRITDRFEPREMLSSKWMFGGAVAAILLLILWIGYEPLVKRLGSLREGANEYSVVTRTEYWRGAWQMFLDRPLAGVGLGAFPTAYPAYGRSSVRNERLEQAHNDYLQLLADAGLIGAIFGIWFLFELVRILRHQFRQVHQTRSLDRALMVGSAVAMLGIAVHSFLDFNLQIAANALLFLLVAALSATIDLASTNTE
jgi:O-antigen ligase